MIEYRYRMAEVPKKLWRWDYLLWSAHRVLQVAGFSWGFYVSWTSWIPANVFSLQGLVGLAGVLLMASSLAFIASIPGAVFFLDPYAAELKNRAEIRKEQVSSAREYNNRMHGIQKVGKSLGVTVVQDRSRRSFDGRLTIQLEAVDLLPKALESMRKLDLPQFTQVEITVPGESWKGVVSGALAAFFPEVQFDIQQLEDGEIELLPRYPAFPIAKERESPLQDFYKLRLARAILAGASQQDVKLDGQAVRFNGHGYKSVLDLLASIEPDLAGIEGEKWERLKRLGLEKHSAVTLDDLEYVERKVWMDFPRPVSDPDAAGVLAHQGEIADAARRALKRHKGSLFTTR